MIDVLPKLLVELRDAAAVDALVDGRVRGLEPAPDAIHPSTGAVIRQGDSRGPGEYVPFVVLTRLGSFPHPRLPIQRARIAVRCYGRTPAEAYAVYAACFDAVHDVGQRVHANGLGIYLSKDDTGASQERDPDTDQPVETFVVDAWATTVAVGA